MIRVQELAERALELSQADGCIVVADEHSETNLRWAANSLTTNGQMSSRSVTVISTVHLAEGTSAGVITRTVSDLDELADLVRASELAARAGSPAEDAAPLVADYEHGDDWDAPAAATSVEVFAEFAPALGRAFARAEERGEQLYGFAEHQVTSHFLASSTGLRRRFDQPDGRIELNAKSSDLERSAWAGQHTESFADVDVDALTESLHQRLEWARNKIDLPAGRYETILPPTAVADLLVYTYWMASARDAEEGRNVFSAPDGTKIGAQVSPLPLRLYSDPAAAGLSCAPFELVTASSGGLESVFDNGAPTQATAWIENGALRDLIRTRAWGARTNLPPRAFVGNLLLDAGPGVEGASLEQMIASTERGLLLTCLWYIRIVDPQTFLLTGLTRDGVYLIEDGAVVGAVNNFRFNESPIDLLQRVNEVGASELTMSREWSDYFRRTAMPAMRIPDFNMSTVSQAS